jgi:AbrB family looped-hinge helix DNA binding protein
MPSLPLIPLIQIRSPGEHPVDAQQLRGGCAEHADRLAAGRVVLPKPIRDALGLLPGTKVDISPYGAGAQILPAGRTARLVEEDGVLVAAGETPVDDDVVFALIDAGRK